MVEVRSLDIFKEQIDKCLKDQLIDGMGIWCSRVVEGSHNYIEWPCSLEELGVLFLPCLVFLCFKSQNLNDNIFLYYTCNISAININTKDTGKQNITFLYFVILYLGNENGEQLNWQFR